MLPARHVATVFLLQVPPNQSSASKQDTILSPVTFPSQTTCSVEWVVALAAWKAGGDLSIHGRRREPSYSAAGTPGSLHP